MSILHGVVHSIEGNTVSKSLPGAPPVLAGYTYIRPLGVGGFADVFLFEQNMPRRLVAVKVLLQSVVDDDVIRMFNTEADVMARLSSHPSIVTVYDASLSADGRPYIVMEYCPGSYSTRYRREEIPVAEVLNTGVKVASALETAHRAGMLHRDIKPSNLLVNGFGTPVLADFGISASLAGVDGDQLFAMSVPWSAPEVVEKRITGSVGTELWGLGATLYTLLSGRSPFEVDGTGRNSSELLGGRISKAKYTPIPRQDVPQRLQDSLARSMSREPRQRQSSLMEFAAELQFIQHELGIMPTALEVAADGWLTASAEVNFDNTEVRGPVVSRVPVESKRVKVRREAVARVESDETFTVGEAKATHAPALRRLVIAASVVVVLAIGAIGAAVIVGGL